MFLHQDPASEVSTILLLQIFASVQRIKQSLQRGKDCLSSVKLKAIRDSSRGASCLDRPGLYVKDDSGKSAKVSDLLLYPPASADETEYQILKFYDFTRNLEFSVLKVQDCLFFLFLFSFVNNLGNSPWG